MRQSIYILLAPFLLLPLSCSHESEPGQESAPDETTVSFTASAGREETKAAGLLTDAAKVIVHAWTGAALSEASTAPVHTNNYSVTNVGSVGSLTPVGASMKVQTGVPYFFYALSSNSSETAVPALNGNYTTVSLDNGIDYLMAVAKGTSDKGYTFNATDNASVPLSFLHLATKIELTVQPAMTDGYTDASGLLVGIASIDGTGSFIDLSKAKILWPALGDDGTNRTGGIPLDSPDGQTQQGVSDNSNTFTVSFIILPVYSEVQGIPLQLDFTEMKFDAGDVGVAKSYTAQILKKSGQTALILEGGKTYSFTVSISRHSATFSLPKVTPWENMDMDVDNMEEEVTTS